MLVRGKSLDVIKHCLDNYCRATGCNNRMRLYALTSYGHGYSLSSLVERNSARLAEVITLALLGKVAIMRLPLAADGLRVKNGIRVFYGYDSSNGLHVTAKIALPSEHRTGSLAQEISVRRSLTAAASGSFALPHIHRYDNNKASWFEEDFIATEGANPKRKVDRFLREVAVCVYEPSLTSASLAEALQFMGTQASELEALHDLPEQDRSFSEDCVTVSRIHGDLSPANMIDGHDGRLYLIDWELSILAPIAWDLKKLFTYDAPGVLQLIDELRRPGDASARDQMRLALCCQLSGLRRDREKRLSYLVTNRNKSRRKAIAMIEKQEKELVSWIAELARA